MNAAPLRRNTFLNDVGTAYCGIRSTGGITCASNRDDKSHYDDFQRVAVRATRGLYSKADAAKIAIRDVEVIKTIHEKFLSRKRLYQIAPAHARNSQPAGSDDCTNKCNCKKIRFRIASSSFVACCASRCISSAFLFLKINHLRRFTPDQVL